MPLEKFRSHDDAERALWLPSGDPSILVRLRALLEFSHRLCPGQTPRGVRKFRSLAEAQAEREEWVQARIDRLQAERKAQ
ncbi:MAG: hypothetical protein AB7S38_40725 [Vulcanimicrobiota bacterium]